MGIDVDVIKYKNDNLDKLGNEIQDLDVCVSYNGATDSGMIVAEMRMVSGWAPAIPSFKEIEGEWLFLLLFLVGWVIFLERRISRN